MSYSGPLHPQWNEPAQETPKQFFFCQMRAIRQTGKRHEKLLRVGSLKLGLGGCPCARTSTPQTAAPPAVIEHILWAAHAAILQKTFQGRGVCAPSIVQSKCGRAIFFLEFCSSETRQCRALSRITRTGSLSVFFLLNVKDRFFAFSVFFCASDVLGGPDTLTNGPTQDLFLDTRQDSTKKT